MTTPTRAIPQPVADNVFPVRRGESYWAARIELPQLPSDAQPVVLRVATAELTVYEAETDDTYNYTAQLKPSVQVKFSSGKSPDGGELVIENFSRVLGQTIAQLDRKLSGSRVTVYKVWRVYGSDVSDAVFVGYTKAPKVNGDEVRFALVSDMSRKGAVVGGSLLTMRCKWIFKDGVHCTYAGAEVFCSHVLDDAVAGCKAYGHEFEFDGIPTRGAIAVEVAGDNPNPTGFGDPDELFPNPRTRRFDRDFHPELVPFRVY